MSESPALKMVPTKPDADLAADIRKEIAPHLDRIIEIVNRARAQGLVVSFNIQPDQFGRMRCAEVGVVKPL